MSSSIIPKVNKTYLQNLFTKIEKWNDGMKYGILVDGVLVGKVSDATRGMYLRTCRVIWNECTSQGFLTDAEYPFSNRNNSLISIPRGKLRQQSYLSVDEMTQLYNACLVITIS